MKRLLPFAIVAAALAAGPVYPQGPEYTRFEAYCAKINEVERAALTRAEVAKLVDQTLARLQSTEAPELHQSLLLWKQYPYKLSAIDQALKALESTSVPTLLSLRSTATAHRAKTLEFLEDFQAEPS